MPDETNEQKNKGKEKDARGVKPGSSRGPYAKKPAKDYSEDVDALYKRVQALEDAQGTGGRPDTSAGQGQVQEDNAPEDDWL